MKNEKLLIQPSNITFSFLTKSILGHTTDFCSMQSLLLESLELSKRPKRLKPFPYGRKSKFHHYYVFPSVTSSSRCLLWIVDVFLFPYVFYCLTMGCLLIIKCLLLIVCSLIVTFLLIMDSSLIAHCSHSSLRRTLLLINNFLFIADCLLCSLVMCCLPRTVSL